MNIDIQLENLKGNIMRLAMEIEEAETFERETLMNKLYEISGQVDDISQDYENRKQQIKELI